MLKNALDWASRPPAAAPLKGVPVGRVGASLSAYGAVWAQQDARRVLAAAGARVVDAELAVPRANQAFQDDGRLADPDLRERLAALLDELVDAAVPTGAARSPALCSPR